MMKTNILINNLKIQCHIGVTDEERSRLQTIVINITVKLHETSLIVNDDIENTLSYSDMRKKIIAFVKSSEYKLLETLANELADICLREPLSEIAVIRIEKPHLYDDTESVGVEIEKSK